MRELCIEDIAMSTRVAFPTFLGCRMSDLRRHLAHSPTPSEDRSVQQAQVRRNLFGPIDHDENLKFVQNELSKISQADCKKWNFDFEAEKPQEGRYTWEPVVEGVPQAYEMPRLQYLSSNKCGGVSATTSSSLSQLSPPSSSSNIVALPVPESSNTTTTTSTTTNLQTINKTLVSPLPSSSSPSSSLLTLDKPTSKTNQPSCSKDTKSSSEQIRTIKQTKVRDLSVDSLRRSDKTLSSVKHRKSESTQPQVTTFLKIRKTKRAANSKLEDDQPPALVKRTKTSSS